MAAVLVYRKSMDVARRSLEVLSLVTVHASSDLDTTVAAMRAVVAEYVARCCCGSDGDVAVEPLAGAGHVAADSAQARTGGATGSGQWGGAAFESSVACWTFFGDAYLHSIAAVPGRSAQRSIEKVAAIIAWREQRNVRALVAAPPPAVAAALARGAFPPGGRDASGRAVLCIVPAAHDWSRFDRGAVLQAHVVAIESALSSSPSHPAFAVCVDASGCGLRQNDIAFLRELMGLLTVAYPDRLHVCWLGPTSSWTRLAFTLLRPFMPSRLSAKIRLLPQAVDLPPD